MIDIFKLAEAINNSGFRYYDAYAKAWASKDGLIQRIYWGKDYITFDPYGNPHNRRFGKARALTAADRLVDKVKEYLSA